MKPVMNYSFEEIYNIYVKNCVNKDKMLTKEQFYNVVWIPRKEIYG